VKAWLLARKDLSIYFRDRAGVALGFGLPIALCTVFGAAMGAMGGGGGAGRVEFVVEDQDGSDASRALLAELGKTDGLRLETISAGSEGTARDKVAEGDAPTGMLIQAGYGERLAEGKLALTLYRDPGKVIEQQILLGNLAPVLLDSAGKSLGRAMGSRALEALDFPLAGRAQAQQILDATFASMEDLIAGLEEEEGSPEEPEPAAAAEAEEEGGSDFATKAASVLGITLEDVVGGDANQKAEKIARQAFAVAGMAVMMLLFGLVHCGGTLLDEEEHGTLERLRLVPGAARAVLGGKFLFTWLIGLVQLVVMFAFGAVVFDVPIFRAPAALLVLSLAVAAATTGFGVLFAVLCRTRKQLEGFSTIVVLTMSASGGSWWPLSYMPEWFQFLGHFTLNAWAVEGYQKIFWYEQGLLDLGPQLGVLCAIALGCALLAVPLWNRRVRV
jgi:ABC-2 type transport system permease protein